MASLSFLNENIDLEAEDDLPSTQIVDDRVLKDVVAYVEVRSTNDNRSEAVRRELSQLGATVVKKFTSDVTHVVFKEGSNRTKTKAQKKCIHLVSVLWVENCKLNQEHVSERMYPAVVPKLKGTPLLMTKLKKAKSMQPRDFEEELASSAERVGRKRKKLDAINRLKSTDTTPASSPRPTILVQDTQPRSPDDGFVLTPIRLTIPDTPPSMREKLRKLREAKEGACDSHATSVLPVEDMEERHVHFKQLQKKLFKSRTHSGDESNNNMSSNTSSVFITDSDNEAGVEEDEVISKTNNTGNGIPNHNVSIDSESSLNNDILKIAQNINVTLSTQKMNEGTRFGMFGEDSDENLLNSQEIRTVVNVSVKLKPPLGEDMTAEKVDERNKNLDISIDSPNGEKNVKKKSQKPRSSVQTEETDVGKKQRRRSSRRLSVQQAVQELDKSSLLDKLPEKDENPIPSLTISSNSCSLEDEQKCDKPKRGKGKPKKSGRNSSPRLNENEQDDKTRDEINRSHDNHSKSLENETKTKSESESGVEDGKRKKDSPKAAKGKKTMKKKLMSLTDLTEQRSVLIEPTKCSSVERSQLEPTKGKMGRNKQATRADKSSDTIEADNDASKKKKNNNKDSVEQSNNAGTVKGRRKRKSNEDNAVAAESNTSRKRRNTERVKSKGKKTLVDETHIENDVLKTRVDGNRQSPMAKIQDVTTQLNLTKDNGLVCSIRETTLSLSMSTAYTDANMPSFLKSQRKSIDEFSASQRQKKMQNCKDRSTLSSICEKENVGEVSSSDSDRSLNSRKKRGKVSNSQHRKLVRPSIVMTSLHSHEQDVVISVVKKLGGFVIAENVNETTTHVICGEPRRTLNVLQCLARGMWLLTKEWVIKSLEVGEWIPEVEFEYTSAFPACKAARLECEKNPGYFRQSLFNKIGAVYISGRSQPPRQHLVQLIKLCGGQVIGVRERASIYLGSDYHPGMTCVKPNWLLDCITSQQLLPMDRYYLDRPKRESSPAY